MKPLHLELYGFGAFAEPCKISFTDWQDGEVFLITGETGAGKTTIFDAICFALYGTASGSERESRQFRSQYLTDSTAETKVRLEFLDNGKRYLVERNPAYERQKQRGIGTVEQKANATLYELLPNGEKTCICSGFKTVTCEITERIGMESTQFQQIVMIAQGEFRRFLLSNSIEKGQILSKLFHTESCGRIRDRLKQRYDAKTQEISMQTISIAAKLKTVAPHEATRKQQYQELLAEEKTVATSPICCQLLEEDCRERLEQLPLLEKEQERFQQSVDQLVQQMEQGRRHNQNCFRLEQQQKELQQLQQRQTVAAELLERAEINAVQIPEWQDAAAQLERSVPEYQHLADLQKELLTLQKQSQQLQQEQAQKKATLEQTQQACAMLQKEVEEHAACAAELESTKTKMVQKQQALQVLQQLQQQFAAVRQAEADCAGLEQQAQQAHQQYYQVEKPKYDALEQQFFQSMAGNLAAQLQAGVACPVCGSLEHPHPAEQTQQTVSEQQFQRARKQQEAALQAMQSQKSQLEKQQAVCAQLQTQKQQLLQQHKLSEQTTAETLEAMLKKIRSGISALTKQQKQLQEQLQQRTEQQAALKRKQEALPILQNAVTAQEQAVQALLQKITGKRTECDYVQNSLQYGTLQEAQQQLLCFRQKIEQAQLQQKRAQAQVQELEKQLAACQDAYSRLEAEIAGKPLYDTAGAEQTLLEFRRQLSQKQREIAMQKADLQQVQETVAAVRLSLKTLEQASQTWMTYKELYSMINGTSTEHGGERISLERYVQAYYFTRILEHANQKLDQLSNGRYQLIRRKEEDRKNISSGLNLNVLDQYTGTERDVKTLSGGETFLASLSLALGLSEAVQQQSGCVQINAMFIDEGFGSLDEMALENAIQLLQQLSGHDCMVGIISHVSALAERFDAQIRVEKTPCGSRAVCVGKK